MEAADCGLAMVMTADLALTIFHVTNALFICILRQRTMAQCRADGLHVGKQGAHCLGQQRV